MSSAVALSRQKHGRPALPDDELTASLIADDRVLLVFTPSGPPSGWTTRGLG